ncbi:MAG: hypothetical protein AB7D38_12305 [Sulfurimonas sp.]|uniref:hypothetical protein n=1 Tax=Sulfurimonas sp. TaxID=2022749 RepID=UPI003D0EC5EB
MINTIATILGIHRNSYFNYKKQGRPIISLLEKYFTKKDLEEFLESGRVRKLDNIDDTIAISIISFLQKLDVLYQEGGNPDLFYRFIVYYIQYSGSFNDWDDSYPWQGLDEIEEFQEVFYQYLIDSDTSMKQLRHTSLFINQLSRADLLFLNMNILDGFELMFNFKHPDIDNYFFSMHTRSDLLIEMKHGLEEALREVVSANRDDSIKQIVEELIEKTRETRIQAAKISPE